MYTYIICCLPSYRYHYSAGRAGGLEGSAPADYEAVLDYTMLLIV